MTVRVEVDSPPEGAYSTGMDVCAIWIGGVNVIRYVRKLSLHWETEKLLTAEVTLLADVQLDGEVVPKFDVTREVRAPITDAEVEEFVRARGGRIQYGHSLVDPTTETEG